MISVKLTGKMTDADTLVDKFSGFITKEQAEKILNEGVDPNASFVKQQRPPLSIKDLLFDIRNFGESNSRLRELTQHREQLVNVQDKVYRIFNSTAVPINGKSVERRSVILGEEGATIRFNLKGNICSFIDLNAFERGDTITITNAVIDPLRAELKSGSNTVINKMEPSRLPVINDFSQLKDGQRKVDIVGRIMEIGSIRHVNVLSATTQIAVSSCMITDGTTNIDASLWGSSALKTATMKANDHVKMEFCDVRMREGKLQVYANDISRVVTGSYFATKLQKK